MHISTTDTTTTIGLEAGVRTWGRERFICETKPRFWLSVDTIVIEKEGYFKLSGVHRAGEFGRHIGRVNLRRRYSHPDEVHEMPIPVNEEVLRQIKLITAR